MNPENIYKKLPRMHCKGLCQEQCTIVPLFHNEARRIQNKHGALPEPIPPKMTCSFLKNGKCAIYEDRPLICRLFGMVKSRMMKCPHGCRPKRWLKDSDVEELYRIMGPLEETSQFIVNKINEAIKK